MQGPLVEFFERVKDFFKSNYGEATIYVLISLGGSLMPVWGGLLLYEVFSLDSDFWTFVDNGQFYLLSAALFTPSCYQLYKNKSNTNLFHSFVFLVSIFLLIVAAILFAGTTVFDLPVKLYDKSNSVLVINLPFLRITSLFLLIFSILVAFISQAIDSKLGSGGPNMNEVNRTRSNDVEELNRKFDELEK